MSFICVMWLKRAGQRDKTIIKQLLLLPRVNTTLLAFFSTGKIKSAFEILITFIKFPKRTDCFAPFSKVTYLHMHSNIHVKLPVS